LTLKNHFKSLFLIAFFPFYSLAQTVTLELGAAMDNSMFSENSAESNGAGNNLFAGRIQNGTAFRRGLIKFDVSAVPSDVIIQSVVLELYVYRSARSTTNPHNFNIHKVLSDWGEAGSSGNGSGAAAQTGDATWSQRFYPNTDWSASGGDFEPSSSASQMVAYNSINLERDEWSSPQMVLDLLSWLANPSTNYGWILIGDETINGSAKGFASREMAPPFDYARPKLTITYTLPIVKKIIINELNPKKNWVELYNPGATPIDVTNYSLANGANSITVNGATILNGNLLLDAQSYLVLKWPNISEAIGELALYDGALGSSNLIDYLQYGAASQTRSAAAVTASVWDNAANFKPSISDSAKSYSLGISQMYANGTESNASHFNEIFETPTYINNPCLASLILKGNLLEADYYTSESIQITGEMIAPKDVQLDAGNAIYLNAGLFIQSGNVFSAEIGGCGP
jgi:hypothetical protein